MKKDISTAILSSPSGMKLVPDYFPGNDTAAYLQLDPGFAKLIGLKKITTPLRDQPLDHPGNRIFKRTADVILSFFVIVLLLSWLIPLIAIIIKLTSQGPVFFTQKRVKRNGEVFTCIKFRSMCVNDDADILPATKNDARVTKFGRFMRDHFLDELPQFFNVLLGDMSIIGPRPHMIYDNIAHEQMMKNYSYRHRVKPGITGLSQVLGFVGPIEDAQELSARVNIDIFYVRHWNARLDIIIFFRTIKKLVSG